MGLDDPKGSSRRAAFDAYAAHLEPFHNWLLKHTFQAHLPQLHMHTFQACIPMCYSSTPSRPASRVVEPATRCGGGCNRV